MHILILEDSSERIKAFVEEFEDHDLVICTTSKSAIRLIQKDCSFNAIFLDHDLGGKTYVDSNENSGFEVVKTIVSSLLYLESRDRLKIIVHSWNEQAAVRMELLLKENEFTVIRKQFGFFDKGILYE